MLSLCFSSRRRLDDRRIHQGAALEQQPTRFQHVAEGIHQLHGQCMPRQQTPKLEDRSFIGQRIVGQLETGEAPHRLDLVQGIFESGVG